MPEAKRTFNDFTAADLQWVQGVYAEKQRPNTLERAQIDDATNAVDQEVRRQWETYRSALRGGVSSHNLTPPLTTAQEDDIIASALCRRGEREIKA